MKKQFNDLTSLFSYINEIAGNALQNEVKDLIYGSMSDAVQKDVYEKYDRSEYVRRGVNGGLADPSNYRAKIVNHNTIHITNETKGNEGYSYSDGWDSGRIDGVIVYGTGYHWMGSRMYRMQPFPRDFYGGTVRRLKGSRKHIQVMREALKKRGLNVK